jgi:hypothetical protein
VISYFKAYIAVRLKNTLILNHLRFQDVLPRLSLTLADICKVVPKLQEQAQSLLAKSPSLGDATEADVIDEMQDETDLSSATITEV